MDPLDVGLALRCLLPQVLFDPHLGSPLALDVTDEAVNLLRVPQPLKALLLFDLCLSCLLPQHFERLWTFLCFHWLLLTINHTYVSSGTILPPLLLV